MSTCDMRVWVPVGERIKAASFTNCNTWISVNSDGLSRSVHFRPGTDPSGEALDIYNCTSGKWVEYQVEAPSAKNYKLNLRYKAESPTKIEVSVGKDDKVKPQSISLDKLNAWVNGTYPLSLKQGRNIIRLKVTGGKCALNWLKVE
jgi:hypothetical protein